MQGALSRGERFRIGCGLLGGSSWRRGSRATPSSGALAGNTAKEPREVRLIGMTATHGDLCEGGRRCQHQPLGPLDSPSH
jgi:hypothetical protein